MLEDVSVDDSPAAEAPVPQVDVSRPHPARTYDYYLGGKNHYAADRLRQPQKTLPPRPFLPLCIAAGQFSDFT
jgi:hypothetical protein